MKNTFAAGSFYDHTILDEKGAKICLVRTKPTGIAYKPKGQHKFYSVTLKQFEKWITDPATGARRTKK